MDAPPPSLNSLANMMKKKMKDNKNITVFSPGDLVLNEIVRYAIPTGLPQLDLALASNGYPAGKIVEIYGYEGCGKTTLAYHAIAQIQKMGGTALFIDTERSFDDNRARQCGVNTSNLLTAEADTVESIFDIIIKTNDSLIDSEYDKPFLYVVDSVTGVPTDSELQKDLGKTPETIGVEAKAIRRGLKRVHSLFADSGTAAIFINHSVAANIGTIGKKSAAAGGKGLKFYSSSRIMITKLGNLKVDKTSGVFTELYGIKVKIEVEKLKGRSLRWPIMEVPLLRDSGFDQLGNLMDAMIQLELIDHPKGSKTYTLLSGTELECDFPRVDWPGVIEDFGGYDAMYKIFMDHAEAKGHIVKYGQVAGT